MSLQIESGLIEKGGGPSGFESSSPLILLLTVLPDVSQLPQLRI
jgi:hypothetical protein